MTVTGATMIGRVSQLPRSDGARLKRGGLLSSAATTAIFAWAGLFLFCRFLWTKIDFNMQGTGWILLPAFGVCVGIVGIMRMMQGERLVVRHSFAWTLLFMLYVMVRLAIDSTTLSDFVGYTVGYGNGVMFAYLAGLALRVLLEAASNPAAGRLRWIGAMAVLLFNLVSVTEVQSGALATGDVVGTYALVRNETYQVSGALASVLAVACCAISVDCAPEGRGTGRTLARVVTVVLALAVLWRLALMSQIMGSNAGPAFILPLGVLLVAVWFAPYAVRTASAAARHMHWRQLARHAFAVASWSLVLVMGSAGLLYAAVSSGAVDVTQYRAFGFDQASLMNSSVASRFELLDRNFLTHLGYEPVFGNFFVDRLTTGDGSYAHSLIAVLPHLGLVGTFLFLAMWVAIAKQLRAAWIQSQSSITTQRFAMLSIVVIGWSSVFLLLTNFFTSVLLWLPLGMLAPFIQLVRNDGALRARGY
jgi:hypothetical protein